MYLLALGNKLPQVQSDFQHYNTKRTFMNVNANHVAWLFNQ